MKTYGLSKLERWILYPLLLALFVTVSFFDLPITQTLYDPTNFFGRLFEFIGEQPFQLIGVIASFLLFRFRDKSTKVRNVLYGILFVFLAVFFAVYAGGQFFSYAKDLSANPKDFWQALPIALFLVIFILYMVAGALIAHYLKVENEKDVFAFALGVVILYVLVWVVMTGLKTIWQRPRWRYLVSATVDPAARFKSVWQPSPAWPFRSNYASFPSGHTMNAVGTLCLTTFFSTHMKIGKPIYYRIGGYLWAFLVALSRIIVGAHFASDVTMGFLLGTALYDVTYSLIVPWIYGRLNAKKSDGVAEKVA